MRTPCCRTHYHAIKLYPRKYEVSMITPIFFLSHQLLSGPNVAVVLGGKCSFVIQCARDGGHFNHYSWVNNTIVVIFLFRWKLYLPLGHALNNCTQESYAITCELLIGSYFSYTKTSSSSTKKTDDSSPSRKGCWSGQRPLVTECPGNAMKPLG